MASQSRKHRGYATQRIVASYMAANGWRWAEPVGAGRPGSDITGVPGLDIEVKARRGFDPLAALRQQADRASQHDLSFAVLRMDGQGEACIEDWPVVLRLGPFLRLLRDYGYGDLPTSPTTDNAETEQQT